MNKLLKAAMMLFFSEALVFAGVEKSVLYTDLSCRYFHETADSKMSNIEYSLPSFIFSLESSRNDLKFYFTASNGYRLSQKRYGGETLPDQGGYTTEFYFAAAPAMKYTFFHNLFIKAGTAFSYSTFNSQEGMGMDRISVSQLDIETRLGYDSRTTGMKIFTPDDRYENGAAFYGFYEKQSVYTVENRGTDETPEYLGCAAVYAQIFSSSMIRTTAGYRNQFNDEFLGSYIEKTGKSSAVEIGLEYLNDLSTNLSIGSALRFSMQELDTKDESGKKEYDNFDLSMNLNFYPNSVLYFTTGTGVSFETAGTGREPVIRAELGICARLDFLKYNEINKQDNFKGTAPVKSYKSIFQIMDI